MAWDHVLWAARRAGAPDAIAHHVLLQIATHTNARGRAWPSIPTLAGETGLGVTTVRRAVRRLELAGALEVIHRRGRACEYLFPQDPHPGRSGRHPSRSRPEPRPLRPPKELKELEGTPTPARATTWQPAAGDQDAGPVAVRAALAGIRQQLARGSGIGTDGDC